jgi:competence protein ComEC
VLHKEIPFLRIIVPLCLGIISGKLFLVENTVLILLVILSLFLFIVSLFYNSHISNYAFGIAVFSVFFTGGLILTKIEEKRISSLESKPAIFLITLSDYPLEKEKTYMLTAELNRIISDSSEKIIKGSLIIYHRKDSLSKTLKPGDILLIKCTPVEISSRGNPYEFDYKSFMESKGIRYYCYTSIKNILSHKVPSHKKLKYKALIIRERIIKMFRERGVKGERLALVSAITLGQKNLLDPEAKQIFINAGVMHIMAVSGLHVVILSLFILNVLFFLKRRYNFFRILITILLLWAFAFVTGLSPSVLRATLMFTFIQAGNLMNRKVNGINSVLASAFFLIILQPSVITDAGFLLSYAAVIYIIGFYNDLYLKIHFHGWLQDKLWQSVAVTLIAQAGTLPLTIMLFNRFPVYFILTNVIIVPLSNLLIIVGCLVPLTYHIVPVSEFLATLLDKLTGLTEFLTETAATLPYSTIDKIGMTPFECILLTLVISLFIVFLLKKDFVNIVYPLAAMFIFMTITTVSKILIMRSQELIVYNNPSNPAIGIRTGNCLHLYAYGDSMPKEVLRHAATLGLKMVKNHHSGKPVLLETGGRKILITDSLKGRWLMGNRIDILILSRSKPYIEKSIRPGQLPENVIITSEAVPGFNLRSDPDDPVRKTIWYVRKSGAFILRLN